MIENEDRSNVISTPILDIESRVVRAVVEEIERAAQGELDDLAYVRAAYTFVRTNIAPAYELDEMQPISRTLCRGTGSCSQRLAVLEGLARSRGIATRVEGRLISGRFWSKRFPCFRAVLPDVVLAWPEFYISERWMAVQDAVSGDVEVPIEMFSNSGAETLFDAAGRHAVSWAEASSKNSFIDFVVREFGTFSDRDTLFLTHGTVYHIAPMRFLAQRVLNLLGWKEWGRTKAASRQRSCGSSRIGAD